MLPLYALGEAEDFDLKAVLGERLHRWYLEMQTHDAAFQKVCIHVWGRQGASGLLLLCSVVGCCCRALVGATVVLHSGLYNSAQTSHDLKCLRSSVWMR